MLISASMFSPADASRSVSSAALRSSNVVNLADIQFQRCRVTRSDVKLNLRVNTANGSIRQGIPAGISTRWIQYLTCQYADHLSMFRFDYNSIAGLKKNRYIRFRRIICRGFYSIRVPFDLQDTSIKSTLTGSQ